MPTLVFLSHSSKDDAIVTRIHDEIEAETGKDVWVDHRDLTAGDRWQTEIDEALAKCSHMLLILSKESVKSAEVEAEWRDALLRGKALLPVVIDDLELTAIPSRLRTIQSVNLAKDWKDGIEKLVKVITQAHTGTSAANDFIRWPVTGMIDRMLTSIPISGREQDIETVQRYLKQAPTSILGVGGLGKSRMAVEIVLTQAETDGAVWHVCGEYTTPDDVYALLRKHLGLEKTAAPDDVLERLRQEHLLVVLDNAESIIEESRRKDYVKLVNDLYATKGVQVLLTSRVAWADIKASKQHQLDEPNALAAEKIVQDMAAFFEIKDYKVEDYATELAKAARYHPRLIELAVGKLAIDEPKTVIRELTQLESADVQDALDEMIQKTIQQMKAQEQDGQKAAQTLAKWSVCRSGFTREAAGYLQQAQERGLDANNYVNAKEPMILLDEDRLNLALKMLMRWQFVKRIVTEKGQTRYTIEPLVIEAVIVDKSAYQIHFDYYQWLAWRHDKRQDYLGLAPEADNLEAAFEWAMGKGHGEKALYLANAAGSFFFNRGRYRQILEWDERLVAKLADHPDKLLWANAQNSLGIDLRNMLIGNRHENLKRAVAAYEAALVYYTAEAAPLDYAMTQNNLGGAYGNLAEVIDQEGNLKRAVAAYEAALVYWTAEAAPLNYAMTQNNLGSAYGNLAQLSDRETNLHRAMAAYEAALVYRKAETVPLDYATTRYNIALLYRSLAEVENREENLQKAIATYQDILRIQTFENVPLDYADTQWGMGIDYDALGETATAIDCWREAERAFRALGIEDKANLMLRNIALVEKRL